MNYFWRLSPWLLLTAVLIAFVVRKVQWQNRQYQANPNHAVDIDTLYRSTFLPVEAGDIVLVGDSKTERFKANEYFPGAMIKNRGIPSNTIQLITQRLPAIASRKPSAIIIEAGINDIYNGRPIDQITEDYKKAIDTIRRISPETHIYLVTLAPVFNHADTAKFNEGVAKINLFITSITMLSETDKEFATYAFIHKIRLGARITRDMVHDDVHLNAKGYNIWAEEYGAVIKKHAVNVP